ncbi:MAG: class I SAM-dependent methyltransferase [Anaerolineae bacterium]|nr:class I SAM-dependent methyltransferase [Anaerolineae bacterium]
MKFDFSFDKRVAKQYEAQRTHPPEVARQIGSAIAVQAGAAARVLEIGIGTGRIARPVVAAGCHVTGFDLSWEMLTALERPSTTHTSLAILQADMHHLPITAKQFDAVMAVHVLHLATDWQQVLREAARVLKPGGAFIQGDDWIDPESVTGRLRDELRRQAMALSPNTRPPAAGIGKQALLAELGGTQQEDVIAAEWTTWISPNERLEAIQNRMDAESWMFPDAVFNILFQKLQAYAAESWPNLDEKQPVTRRFLLKVSRGNWA